MVSDKSVQIESAKMVKLTAQSVTTEIYCPSMLATGKFRIYVK